MEQQTKSYQNTLNLEDNITKNLVKSDSYALGLSHSVKVQYYMDE